MRFSFGSSCLNLLSLALCMSSGFQQGYIATVLNQPYLYIQGFINDTIEDRFGEEPSKPAMDLIWSGLNAMFPISVIVGQFIAAWMCHKYGRRMTGLISCALYVPGTLLGTASLYARSWELLFVGRILWSLANGIQSVNATVWIVECAPPAVRGAIGSMQELSMAIGSLVAQAAGIPFSSDEYWHLVFLPNVPFLVLSAAIFLLLPDSPTAIVDRIGDMDAARKSLARYYGVDVTSPELDAEMSAIESKLAADNKLGKHADSGVTIGVIFNPFRKVDARERVIRWAAWLGVLVKIAYVATGARCLRGYSAYLLHDLSAFDYKFTNYANLAISILRVVVTFLPVLLVDRVGRRFLINMSMLVTSVCLAVIIASIHFGVTWQWGTLIGFTVLILANSCGIGAVSRFYAAELVPKAILLSTTSVLAGLEIVTKVASEFAWYPLAGAIGEWSLLEFFIPSALLMAVLWRCPETSGRTVNQVLTEMAGKMKLDARFD